MFTGIVSHLGKLESKNGSVFDFGAERAFCKQIEKGSSVAVNGVCLTIVSALRSGFRIEVMPETLRRTALADLKIGSLVNLELPMGLVDRFSGHIVEGHVDGVGTISNIRKEGNSRIFTFRTSKKLAKYIVPKGSVAVNGISLTVVESKTEYFTVGIIPYTWKKTMLQESEVGDRVNIEVDILAKYLFRLVKNYMRR